MSVLSLRSAAASFASSQAVMDAVAKNGELTISAGQMAKQKLPDQATYKQLAAALGADAPLFKFRKSQNTDTKVPVSVSLVVFASSDIERLAEPKVYGVNLDEIENVEFQSYVLDFGGYSRVRIGEAEVDVDMPVSAECADVIKSLEDGNEKRLFTQLRDGAPEVTFKDNGESLPTLRAVPQLDLPPHADTVPVGVGLTVESVLNPSRQYNEPRIAVRRADNDELITGLIASGPIRQAIGERNGNAFFITEAIVGESFEIVEKYDRRDRNGEVVLIKDKKGQPILDEDGKQRAQRTVSVRRTTGGGVELDLGLAA